MNPLLAKSKEVTAVVVEYTRAGERVRKTFRGSRAVGDSRSFYRRKLADGADPRVVGADRGKAG